jgi:hypothetical protein
MEAGLAVAPVVGVPSQQTMQAEVPEEVPQQLLTSAESLGIDLEAPKDDLPTPRFLLQPRREGTGSLSATQEVEDSVHTPRMPLVLPPRLDAATANSLQASTVAA